MDFITELSLALSAVSAGVALALLQESQRSDEQAAEEAMIPIPVEERHHDRRSRG